MKYGNIKKCDIANGVGCRTVLFVSGCRHHCKGCFQPQTWDFQFGEEFTDDVAKEIIDSLSPNYVSGLTLLGGEPFEPENQKELVPFLNMVRETYGNTKTIWAFSGYTWEELTDKNNPKCYTNVTEKFLSLIDILVDGEFHIEEKNLSLPFRGSSNQRILDVQKSLKEMQPILSEYH